MAALFHDPLSRFLVQIVLLIVVSRLLGLVLRKIGQPMVIAEMAAGILLGPSLFGLLWPEAFDLVFARSSLGLMQLTSQIGLVLFMFLVGLELDPALLRGRGKSSLAISHTSIALPFALGVAIAFYLRPRYAADLPEVAFALFMGAAMSITAFPVLARILGERRLLRTRIGAIAIACAAVDDLTAWCMLAFVVAAARSTGLHGAIETTVLAMIYLGIMLVVVRPLLQRLAARVSEPTGLSQNIVAVVLVMVFLSSLASERIGIHALFGAFLFGAIVPKEGGMAQALATRLEDLVLIVLLPMFFAVSGLRTSIGLLETPAAWLDCAIVIAIACVGKFGGSMFAARLTGLGWRDSGAIGILMNTRGLMELVVLNVGLDLGVITPAVFSMMVLMALFTTFMTSPLLAWVYPTERFASEPLAPAEESEEAPTFTVMACVAHEGAGANLVALAGALTRGAANHRVYALHLVRSTERGSAVIADDPEEAGAEALAGAVERARLIGVALRPLTFGSAAPARDICEVAAARAVDVTLLGWHRPVLGQSLLGGVVGDVLDHAPGTVGVFVDRGLGSIRRVLVPFRGGAQDTAALELAGKLAAATGAKLTALVIRDPAEKAIPAPAGVEGKEVSHESAIDAVLDESRGHYDLVVIGAERDYGLGDPLFGFTIQRERIMVDCPTSVLVIRGPHSDRALRRDEAPVG